MGEPAFYAHGPERVEVLETAISMVFVAGDFVYKLKKPIELPFLDQLRRDRRRELCLEEVRLNRRLTENVYLGVCAIVQLRGRLRLADGDEGEALEWAVRMRRLPLRQTLAARQEHGELGVDDIRRVARRLAGFHAGAERPDAPAGPGEVKRQIDENFQSLLDMDLGADAVRAIGDAQRFFDAMLSARRRTLLSRSQGGQVRDGHGDLRLEHIVIDADRVQVFDCVEFEPRLRQTDVACDLAYLIMDLAANDREDLAAELIGSYRRAGGDPGDDELLWFFAAYRAWVRIKLAYLSDQPAEQLFALAQRLRWRARRPLLVVCGISASGKSTIAHELASRCGCRVLDSDEIRKQRAGLSAEQTAGSENYSPTADHATYSELGRCADDELARNGGVIVDATCRRRDDRDALRDALGHACARRAVFIECRAPHDVLLRRARDRESDPAAVSDATAEVVEDQRDDWVDLDEIDPSRHLIVRSDREPAEIADEIEAMLDHATATCAEGRPAGV